MHNVMSPAPNCKGSFQILFINISMWGPQAQSFFSRSDVAKTDMWGIAEHHMAKQDMGKLSILFGHHGRYMASSAAKPSGKSEGGTSGGTCIACASHVRQSPRPMGSQMVGNDWVIVPIRLQGLDVLCCQVYLTCGVGFSGEHVSKLTCLATELLVDGRPFVVFGDWNMTPQQLWATGWVQQVEGQCIFPSQLYFTCHSGRMIDFCVVSTAIAEVVSCIKPWLDAPFTAHVPLLLQLERKPLRLYKTVMVVPKRLPEVLGEDKTS